MNLCTFPWSSSHFHLMVPIITFGVCDPAKPFSTLSVGTRSEIKSSMRWDMVAVHLLSIPMGSESVSNIILLATLPASADIAMADIANSDKGLNCRSECRRALACNSAYFHLCFHRLCCTEQWSLNGLIHDRSTSNHCPNNLLARLR